MHEKKNSGIVLQQGEKMLSSINDAKVLNQSDKT